MVATPGNALNVTSAGLVKFDGTATFSAVTTTQHDLLIGAASNGITNVAPSATSGVPVISQGASSDPTFGTAVVAGGGTGAVTFNTNGVIISNTSGTGVLAALSLTSGQIVIGGTTTPAAATLSAGTGVSISNGNNTITINATGAGLTWTDVTGATQTVAASNGYLADRGGGVAFTLPASGTIGDVFRIVGVQGSWTLAQAANQQIKYGSAATTVGATGSLASTNAGDCIECVATNTSASTVWRVMSSIGNITVA